MEYKKFRKQENEKRAAVFEMKSFLIFQGCFFLVIAKNKEWKKYCEM
jgi:hypothetical protein